MPSKCEFLFFMNFDPHPNSNFFADFRCILVLLCYEIGSAWPEKVAQFFQKLPKSCHSSFYLKDMCFNRAHSKVAEHLGYFCKKLCHQDVSKMAQSDHTKEDPRFFPLLFKFCPNSVTSQDAVVFSLSITEIYKLYISVLAGEELKFEISAGSCDVIFRKISCHKSKILYTKAFLLKFLMIF